MQARYSSWNFYFQTIYLQYDSIWNGNLARKAHQSENLIKQYTYLQIDYTFLAV